jgi:hypothetical protein
MRIENERVEGDRDSVRVSLIVRSPLKDGFHTMHHARYTV